MATVQVPIELMAPGANGNAYAALIAGTNVRLLVPAFTKDVDGFWWGKLRVPEDYNTSPVVKLRIGANSTAGQVTSWIVSSLPRDTAAGWDATAMTAETVQDLTLQTTAYRPSDLTFTLSTTPVAGDDMIFSLEHNGSRTQDTLAVDSLLFQAIFQYST